MAHAAAALRAYRRSVVAAQGRDLLDMPFADALRQLNKLRALGFITATHARHLRYGLQIHAQTKREQAELRSAGILPAVSQASRLRPSDVGKMPTLQPAGGRRYKVSPV